MEDIEEMKARVIALKKSAIGVFGNLDGVVLFVGNEQWVSIIDRDYDDESIFKWDDDGVTGIIYGLILRRVMLDDYLAIGVEAL